MKILLVLIFIEVYETKANLTIDTQAFHTIANSTNKFSRNFLKTLSRDFDTNVVSSPLSVAIALSMAAYGAREKTLKELREVLHLPSNDSIAKSGFSVLVDSLNSIEAVELRLASKLFIENGLEIKPKFATVSMSHFRSTSQHVNFSNPHEAANTVNKWCAEQTNDRITKLLTPSVFGGNDTGMFLVNAVYFKGEWKYKFETAKTSKRPFYVDEKTVKKVPMMCIEGSFKQGFIPKLRSSFIELPYKGEEISMIIILPVEINGLRKVEQKFGEIDLPLLQKSAQHLEMKVYLPKFKIEETIDLVKILKDMGLNEMFSGSANFSGIADVPLKVDKFIQKAFIEINEEGSEVAVITGYEHKISTAQMVRFAVNRPFLFMIIEKSSNLVLFSGSIKDFALETS